MKHIILSISILLFLSSTLFSQSLKVIWEKQPLENGAIVTINGVLSDDLFYELVAHARVKNNTDRDISVLVERVTHDTVTGSMNQFCWDSCFAPWVDISPSPYIIPANDTTPDETFSGHYLPQGKIGTTILEYVFYKEDDRNDSVSFIVNFVVSPSSIEDITAKMKFSNAFPNPASNRVNFDFDFPNEVKTASLKIYNLLGQPVAEHAFQQKNGKVSIPVDQLLEGIYLYSLSLNNKPVVTKKLIIRR
ncbi:MAG: hypothetical protein CVT92_00680 [Bacteroidetes bacterium HGW-Bacteroidetes-1]|nr:MAG: hypothetical protein CVT92_00680 [Bacteroidetes bacterium HGW-Bacteroidetes-1]